jgi:NMD protein affecting ribosome stability and mRNA decay
MRRCVACGDLFEEDGISQVLCDACFTVEREMIIEDLGDE